MRSRQCNKLMFLLFILGVFLSGMLSGIYYESTLSGNTSADHVRVAETRHILDAEGLGGGTGRHLHGPSDMKQDVDINRAVDIEDKPLGEHSVDGRSNSKDADKHAGQLKANGVNVNVVHADAERIENIDEHRAFISRKDFGPPIHLEENVQLNRNVPANADIHPPTMRADIVNNQQQLKQQQAAQQQQMQMPQQQQQQPPPAQWQQRQQHQKQQQQPQQQLPQQQPQQQLQQQPQQQPQQQQQLPQQLQQPQQPPQQQQQQQHAQQQQQLNIHPAPAPKPVAFMPAQRPGQPPAAAVDQNSETIPKVVGKIVVSVVICGDRTDEALVMVKSAAILTTAPLHFHIFAENELQSDIAAKLKSWPAPYSSKLTFDLHDIAFPPNENANEWKKMFKKCATQRLFLPDLLVDTDALLYVDTDILFIKPLEYIWSVFKKFNSTQLAALTPEHEVTNIGWYNRFARHPYYGATGLNSGVMLMNLTRMRSSGWSAKILPIYREYKTKTTWGDQDLINILFHFHPEMVYVYQCEFNIRPDHCMYALNCHRIHQEGVAVIHGNRGVYHNEKQLPFRVIYEAFRDYQFGTDMNSGLVQTLKQRFNQPDVANMYCTKALQHPLIVTLQKYCNRHV